MGKKCVSALHKTARIAEWSWSAVAVTPLLDQHLTPKRQVSFSKTSAVRKRCPPKAFGVATALQDASMRGRGLTKFPSFPIAVAKIFAFANNARLFVQKSAFVSGFFAYAQKMRHGPM